MKRWRKGEVCARKVRHLTEAEAGAALGRMHKAFRTRGWKERFLHIYQCGVCGTWHIGHDTVTMKRIEDVARENIRRQRATVNAGA